MNITANTIAHARTDTAETGGSHTGLPIAEAGGNGHTSGHIVAPLPAGHPDAWNIELANTALDADWRRDKLPLGGDLLVTDPMRRLAAGMPSALDRHAVIAVSGPWGCGKSTTLAAITAVADANCAVVDLARGGSTPKQHWQIISRAITGRAAEGTAAQLQEHTREYLHTTATLLIVDEAQNLARQTLMQLRWLWSQPYRQFAVILAGTDLFPVLAADPAIGTRVNRRIRLEHRDTDHIIDLVQGSHPVAAATDRHLLRQVDDTYCQGSWRLWSDLLFAICNDWRHTTGALSAELLNDAIEQVTATPGRVTAPGSPPVRGTNAYTSIAEARAQRPGRRRITPQNR